MFKFFKRILTHHFYDNNYTIPQLIVITGQKCTLNCKNCSNFSPYHSKKLDFYDMDKIINDIDRILQRVQAIKRVQLQGGDFLLHKDAIKILEYINSNDKILKCCIVTNCILPLKKEIIDIVKNQKFEVRLSDYGTTNEIRKNEIETVLKENNIQYRFHNYANKNTTWSDLGGIDTPKHTKKQTVDNYLNCVFKKCLTLENGLISRCSRATVAHLVQGFKPKRSDFINVRSKFFAIHDLKRFIKRQNTDGGGVTACYYCNGTTGKAIPAGEQLTKEELKEIRMKYDK